MTREIKFRAWDKDNKEMIFQGSNTTHENGIMESIFIFDDMDCNLNIRTYGSEQWQTVISFELMQYTGLKDKNGKEIWKGDIVKITDTDDENLTSSVQKIKWDPKACCYPVEVTDFGFDYDLTALGWVFSDGCYEIEVIGNIYENPELLND